MRSALTKKGRLLGKVGALDGGRDLYVSCQIYEMVMTHASDAYIVAHVPVDFQKLPRCIIITDGLEFIIP